jgi:polysaccharide export outer membrane protein
MRRIGIAVFLLWAGMAARAQVQTESLLIGPGDLLHVQTFDTPEFDQHPRVGDDGGAPILFLGKVPLAGKTVQEAGTMISALLVQKQIMRHPQVTVTMEQYATQGVAVSGEVARPGNYAIQTPRQVLEVLSLAGGLTQVANREIVIQHRGVDGGRVTYFVSNDPNKALGEQVWIRPGDTIFVPKMGFVYVLGDVGRPGGYPIATNTGKESLLQAIAMAGSANKTAVLSGVRLLHKNSTAYTEVTVNLDKVQKGKADDLPIVADDVIVVPFSYAKNFVLNGTGIAASIASAALYVY